MAGLSAAVARFDRDEFCRLCDEAKVPAGPILSVDEVLSNEHVLARGMVREFAHPQLGSFKALPVPFKFDGFDDPSLGRPPLLGEHTDQVLADRLGLGKEDIQALRERKVI
jgi:crotonobetainyl-CoA:carnitine CoA-transferase CaiB-like acyl-CoA transferase